MSRLLVHVGPTLPTAEVRRIAPEAEVHPPVEGGMLGRTQPRAGDVIVLIDGYYRDRPSVRHKEIMHLIDNGVTVVGAASMGALRAAELDSHGMVGIGRIYQMYKTGEIDGDDEVAIKHRTAEYDYRKRTKQQQELVLSDPNIARVGVIYNGDIDIKNEQLADRINPEGDCDNFTGQEKAASRDTVCRYLRCC